MSKQISRTTGNPISRRGFLGRILGSGAAAAAVVTGAAPQAQARGNLKMPPKAVGLLYDSTLCTGCKACVVGCKIANNKPVTVPMEKAYLDETVELNPDALNVIQMYKDGVPSARNREKNGFAFFKHSCMHCVDPSCVSACPVSALLKDPENGVVTWSRDACIGCRYCVMACAFRIPKFRYDSAFNPDINKCQLCNHLWAKGLYSACAFVCPTGATLFGPVELLRKEAKRRLALEPGSKSSMPRGRIGPGPTKGMYGKTRKYTIAKYLPHIYGETEGGGTQMLMLSAVDFHKLGLPKIQPRSWASISETVQHTLYSYLIMPAIALGGLMAITWRTARVAEDEGDDT